MGYFLLKSNSSFYKKNCLNYNLKISIFFNYNVYKYRLEESKFLLKKQIRVKLFGNSQYFRFKKGNMVHMCPNIRFFMFNEINKIYNYTPVSWVLPPN